MADHDNIETDAEAAMRYEGAAHRVQTAIAALGGKQLEPKHLRVGIDMGKADMEGLATLLIEKGVLTRSEYIRAMADAAQREADRYEQAVSEVLGAKVRTL